MSRQDLIRTLYIGGQAAIAAELIVVVGIFLFAIFSPDLITSSEGQVDLFVEANNLLDTFMEHRIYYVVGSVLTLLFPTIGMVVVIWAWHLYFAANRVYLMNWVASSMALIGATLMLANFGLSTWSFGLLGTMRESGEVSAETVFIIVTVAEGLQFTGMVALYVFYPMLLSITSWRDHLLPRWFVGLALVLTIIHDLHFLTGGEQEVVAILSQGIIVLWPFLMGVVLLLKAQALAQQGPTPSATIKMTTPTA